MSLPSPCCHRERLQSHREEGALPVTPRRRCGVRARALFLVLSLYGSNNLTGFSACAVSEMQVEMRVSAVLGANCAIHK